MDIKIGDKYVIDGYLEVTVVGFSKSGNFVLAKPNWADSDEVLWTGDPHPDVDDDLHWFDVSLFKNERCEMLSNLPFKPVKVLLREGMAGSVFSIKERTLVGITPSGKFVKIAGSNQWRSYEDYKKSLLETIE
jgi:hypothetical protein